MADVFVNPVTTAQLVSFRGAQQFGSARKIVHMMHDNLLALIGWGYRPKHRISEVFLWNVVGTVYALAMALANVRMAGPAMFVID